MTDAVGHSTPRRSLSTPTRSSSVQAENAIRVTSSMNDSEFFSHSPLRRGLFHAHKLTKSDLRMQPSALTRTPNAIGLSSSPKENRRASGSIKSEENRRRNGT